MNLHADRRSFSVRVGQLTSFWIFVFLAGLAEAALPFVPFPGDVKVSVVGEQLRVNKLPLMGYEFYSRKSAQEVVDFYKEYWTENIDDADSELPFLETAVADWVTLSRLEMGHNITVQIVSAGIYGTRALVGVSPLPQYLADNKRAGSKIYAIPRLPGFEILSVVESVDEGRKSETYWIDSRNNVDVSMQELVKHYRGMGYNTDGKRMVEPSSKDAFSGSLSVVGEREYIRFDLAQIDNKTRIVAVRQGLF